VVGVSSGASTPEHLVEEVIGELLKLEGETRDPTSDGKDAPLDDRASRIPNRKDRIPHRTSRSANRTASPTVEILETVKEDVKFLPPRDLVQLALRN
jgi:hypothetical protein